MNCYLHPDREATAYCRTCGRALCTEDQRDIYGVIYCQECLGRPFGHAPSGTAAAAPATGTSAPPASDLTPSPGLALLLGFIPGVGAIYNGQYVKAFVQIIIFGTLITLGSTSRNSAVHGVFGLATAVFYFYMVIDSYHTARRLRAGLPVDDLFELGQGEIKAPTAAIVLIAIGVLFLLRSLGFFNYDFSRFLWPVLLILIGLAMLRRHNRPPAA